MPVFRPDPTGFLRNQIIELVRNNEDAEPINDDLAKISIGELSGYMNIINMLQ